MKVTVLEHLSPLLDVGKWERVGRAARVGTFVPRTLNPLESTFLTRSSCKGGRVRIRGIDRWRGGGDDGDGDDEGREERGAEPVGVGEHLLSGGTRRGGWTGAVVRAVKVRGMRWMRSERVCGTEGSTGRGRAR